MKKDKKQEELQSRRQFFKKAAKGALPILGAIIISQSPLIGNAGHLASTGCFGGGCRDTCSGSCSGYCGYNCESSCKGGCMGCSGGCKGGCRWGASFG